MKYILLENPVFHIFILAVCMKASLVSFKMIFILFCYDHPIFIFNILYLVNCFSSRTLLDTDEALLKEEKNQLIKNAPCKYHKVFVHEFL